jgi:nitrous oxidase accessory protein NosD
MSYTLRGRLETRIAAALLPILIACCVTLATHEWWPLQLAALMLGVGLVLDIGVYHPVLRYQPGWLGPLLGLLELSLIMVLVLILGVEAPAAAAYGFFAGTWLVGQFLVHAALPLARLSYGEDGGELGRAGPRLLVLVLLIGAAAGGVAWASEPPTVRLSAGTHEGPLVLDEAQKLVGERGAVVSGGIVVTADDVTIRDVTVVSAENGILIDGAKDVLLERVRIRGAVLDGISVRRSSVTIRDCVISARGDYAQGIDISFGADLAPSLVEDCDISGGQEGIFVDSVHATVRDNRVRETTLRGITVTEMAMATVEGNEVDRSLGIGIFCSDYSECEIHDNVIRNTRIDQASSDSMRKGYAIVSHYWAHAFVRDNQVSGSPGGFGAFADAHLTIE